MQRFVLTRWTHSFVLMIALLSLALSACGGSSTSTSTSDTSTSGPPVNITWWVINNDFAPEAQLFNQTHPHIHVTTQKIATIDYSQKLLTAIKAGNAPDTANVEYSFLPAVAGSGGLVDLAQYGASDLKTDYVPWTWNQVSRGKVVYGLPGDVGPMALYYNKEVFDKYKVPVPTTWDEYAAAGAKLHAADPNVYLANLNPKSTSQWYGFIWQAGGRWFNIDGNAWKVSINDAPSQKVANYWQGMLDKKIVKAQVSYTSEWYQQLTKGTIATWVAGAFGQAFFTSGAPAGSGKWRVAPVPTWGGQPSVGNWGGSVGVVTTSSKHPREAYEWVKWLEHSQEGLGVTVKNYGLLPASLQGQTLFAKNPLNTASYFGNQPNLKQIFIDGSKQIDGSFQWGPNMPEVGTDLADYFGQAVSGSASLADEQNRLQETTVRKMQQEGFTVKQ